MSVLQRLRLPLAILIAAVAGLREPVRAWQRAAEVPGPQADAGVEADLAYAPVRATLPRRIGYCFDFERRMLPLYDPGQRNADRAARHFTVQYAIAPVVLVPVLGHPGLGPRDSGDEYRRARLAEVDRVLVEGPVGSTCWDGALAAGFTPSAQAGAGVLFTRARGTPP